MARRSKKKTTIWKTVAKVLVALILIAAATFYLVDLFTSPAARVRYPAFGIPIPPGFDIHGIDVSRYQNRISWDEVRQMKVKNIKIGFAFIKATEGIDKIDPLFRRNWLKSSEAGISRGAYHFFHPNKSARAQANNFVETVDLDANDLPPVLDIEQTNGRSINEIKQKAKEWLALIENHYGVRPIIYTNAVFYETYLGNDFDDYPLWVAHYFQPVSPRISRKWQFWQHSEKGRVNGINAAVDFNVFRGDSAEFREMLVR